MGLLEEWEEAADTDSAGEFASWYADEAEENFNEQFGSPDAVFSSLAQGATGPAPAPTDVNDDGSLDVESPEGYQEVNDTATDVVDQSTQVIPDWAPYAVAVLVLVAVLVALRPYASMASGVAG
jgi:hypothetical protein